MDSENYEFLREFFRNQSCPNSPIKTVRVIYCDGEIKSGLIMTEKKQDKIDEVEDKISLSDDAKVNKQIVVGEIISLKDSIAITSGDIVRVSGSLVSDFNQLKGTFNVQQMNIAQQMNVEGKITNVDSKVKSLDNNVNRLVELTEKKGRRDMVFDKNQKAHDANLKILR